jgi:hypothetical protein
LVSLSQWYFQNRELKRKSAVIAQRWSKEAIEIGDEPDVGTASDGDDLDNLMQTIRGIFHFVLFSLIHVAADIQSRTQLFNDYPTC